MFSNTSPATHDVKKWKWDDHYDWPRDLIGYGEKSFNPQWPNGAKIAVSFVINYEEGAENTVLNGDPHSETMIWDAPGGEPYPQERAVQVESHYDYGSRAGVWRIFRLFNKYNFKYTLFAVGKAIEDNPAVAISSVENGHDIASHGYRWIDYHSVPVEEEKELIRKGIKAIQNVCGFAPKGWYYGRLSPRSHALVWDVYQEMGLPLLWNSDSYSDDLPYYVDVPAEKESPNPKGMLILPYSFDCNDYKFHLDSGFSSPGDFYEQCKNAFDILYEEGEEGMPKMMTIGLHCRVMGRPGRIAALRKFVEYIAAKENVWVATRTQIAEHFREKFPYRKCQRA
ncbi:polysaccharide deacetylase [Mytilinidion resinicola]|uniref:Polysaccharide deacetylase n=1 Tax=Mytilinidion resinicola TaxID=574789 RepID=A0A6A6YIW2_9PEZI|nr:polysaccharide deacetylase [Mytilinidion resinicola]KAF2808488.1 polysaccharide deacetylase [Mytilinidion resinicola]